MELKDTLNLPKTDFSMKADLARNEPLRLKKWQEMGLYEAVMKSSQSSPTFVLHDGPPYANGEIHLGHALNKILKDFVVKLKTMEGYRSTYLPGWDCHGLPIELQVEKLKGKRASSSKAETIKACREYANKYILRQMESFIRLGIFGEWEKRYATMDKGYEANILRAFYDCLKEGYVYRGMKPVHWCIHCETALAEAEVEYEDHSSPSITVRFPFIDDISEIVPGSKNLKCYMPVWTTTPWTLPSNLAVTVHPELDYIAYRKGEDLYVLANSLLESFVKKCSLEGGEVIARFKGSILENLRLQHPFYSREAPILVGDFVTSEEGTGCVHTAPGHGMEDFVVGQRYGLSVYTPVDGKGHYTDDVGIFAGMQVFEANPKVIEVLKEKGRLLSSGSLTHSYPVCWRCKKPVIFRATQQWFIRVDHKGLRQRAIQMIQETKWLPEWGQNRILGMIAKRPDWCISRQRTWGVPLSIFICSDCEEPLIDENLFSKIIEMVKNAGVEIWWNTPKEELLPEGTACAKCGRNSFEKIEDILDVWFDSGVSHLCVLGHREDLPWPSDLYLEGSDQHRGWFHTSLLTAIALKGQAPYRQVITHGFTLDAAGKKMSKTLGNVIDPMDVVKKYGAETLRLWVAMTDYREDVRLSWNLIERCKEAYRKIRNTLRYILGNLYDFDPKGFLPYEKCLEIDRYILTYLTVLSENLQSAYDDYRFHAIYHEIHNLCAVTLSSWYLDILKDRLYIYPKGSIERASAQTVLITAGHLITRLVAPILPFTADEVFCYLPPYPGEQKYESVHLSRFLKLQYPRDKNFIEKWERLQTLKSGVNKIIEEARAKGELGQSLEAKIILRGEGEWEAILKENEAELPLLLIVSHVELSKDNNLKEMEGIKGLYCKLEKAKGEKCERCWNYTLVPERLEEHNLCPRCKTILTH